MPRTRSIAWAELRVGIITVTAAVLVTILVLFVGGQSGFWWQRYPLKARFADANGLNSGAVVRLSGKDVGTVSRVDFADGQIDVTFSLLKSVRPLVTTTSTAAIGSTSLLGDALLSLTPGSGGQPLADYAYVRSGPGGGPMDQISASASRDLDHLDSLLTDLQAGKGTLGRLVTDDAVYTELQGFLTAAGDLTRQLNGGHGTLGELVKDPAAYNALRASLDNLQTMTARLNSGQGALGRLVNDDALGRSLASSVTNLDTVSGRMARGEGTAGKLLTDQQLYDRLNAVAAKLDDLTTGLAAGRGTAGALLRDDQLYDNMNHAVTDLRGLIDAIRTDPQKYLHVRVSIF